ncbi:SsrA-binding protein [Candidatus Peregrinibacteria bacterium]|nr:SsrA-binding protein [Candidatus Peregrinibacteria bacterium]
MPREIYFKGNLLKVEVALVRGRKDYNKKQLLKERTLNREAEVAMKHY